MSEEKKIIRPHHVVLEDRKNLTVSGVEDVSSFDETAVVLVTSAGTMSVEGKELHIVKLSVDTGDLFLQGCIDGIFYTESIEKTNGNWLSRLFR